MKIYFIIGLVVFLIVVSIATLYFVDFSKNNSVQKEYSNGEETFNWELFELDITFLTSVTSDNSELRYIWEQGEVGFHWTFQIINNQHYGIFAERFNMAPLTFDGFDENYLLVSFNRKLSALMTSGETLDFFENSLVVLPMFVEDFFEPEKAFVYIVPKHLMVDASYIPMQNVPVW